MAAAHVRHRCARLEPRLHAVQRGNPFRNQVRRVARPEEALGAVEQRGIVLVPAQPAAVAENIDHLRDGAELRHRDLERARDECEAALLRQRIGLLFVQVELPGGRVIVDVAAGRLCRQPFAQVAHVGMGLCRQHFGGHCFFRHGLV
ncbi:hypothetical protein D3C72_2047840 [compost metagenome]